MAALHLLRREPMLRRMALHNHYHLPTVISMTPLRTWSSSQSGGKYPVAWRIEIPVLGIVLTTSALIDDQENVLSYAYWEGTVAVQGERNGLDLSGYGYIEMTGYATSMAGRL